MKKRTRWLIGVPLGTLAVIVLFFAFVFDWSWLKGLVEDQASSALGREVTLETFDVDLDFDLSPTVTVTGARVANAPWAGDEPLAEVERAAVEVDLLALIGGDLVFPRVDVDAPTFNLAKNDDGTANWSLGGDQQQSSGGGPTIPVIGDLSVTDARVAYEDAAADRAMTAELASIEGALPEEGEVRLDAQGKLDGEQLSLTALADSRALLTGGETPTSFSLDAEIGDDAMTVAGAARNLLAAEELSASARLDVRTPGDLAALLGLPTGNLPGIEADATVTSDGDTLRIDGLDLKVGASDLRGTASIGLGGGPLRIEADLTSSLVDIEELKPLWAGDATGEDRVDERLAAAREALSAAKQDEDGGDDGQIVPEGDPRLPFSFAELPPWSVDVGYRADRITGQDFELRDLDARGRLDDRVPFLRAEAGGSYAGQDATVDMRVGPGEDASPDAPFPVAVTAEAGGTRLVADGTVDDPVALTGIDLRIDAASTDLGQLLGTAGIQAPEIPDFDVVGRVLQENQTWRIEDLLARVGESQVQGRLALDRSGETPLLEGELTSERLIPADLIPEQMDESAPEESDEDEAEGGRPVVGANGIDLAALPDLDVDLRFEGAYVDVEEFRFEPLRFDVRIDDKVPVVTASGQGSFRDTGLSFEAEIGSDAYLENRDGDYPLDVHLESGGTVLDVSGTVAEPGRYTGLDVDVALSGPDLDRLGDIVQLSLPQSPPYELSSNLTHEGATWTLDPLDGKVGDSDIGGTFSIDFAQDRPTIVADLHSRDLDFDDLAPLIGAEPAVGEGETASEEQEREAAAEAADGGLFPDEPLEVPDLQAMDARVTFTSDNVDSPNLPLEEVRIDLTLEDGTLTLDPISFKAAGGELVSTVMLDARPKPVETRLDLTLRNLDFQKVLTPFDIEFSELDTQKEGSGTLHGRAEIQTTGNSIQAMAANANGKVAVMMDGGRINALIVEALGLDVGEALGLVVDEEERATMVEVRCFVADFALESGRMQTRALVLDTIDSKVTGAGEILLGEEKLDLKLKAQARDPSLLSAGTPVQIQGSLTDPSIDVVSDELVGKGLAALGLGVVLPVVGAVIPFISTGEEVPSNCGPLLQQAQSAEGDGDTSAN